MNEQPGPTAETPPPQPGSNLPEYGVGELSAALRATVEGRFGRVRVRGEVVGFKRHSSGHLYFNLKDSTSGGASAASLAAVCWRGVAGRLAAQPQDGLEIVAIGKLSVYADRSQYQLIVDQVELAGEGALLKQIELLRRRLAAEGLFDEGRKRAIPLLPRVVGVVTSPTGAVIRDILHRVAERFPRPVLVWPVPVQGEGAAARVAAAIRGFNALPADGSGGAPRPDVLIVARGGGSLEDLMAFNDEAVVRAAAESAIPLIAAVGHETDWTLIDHAADRRAPTPTAAAEFAVPVRSDLLRQLADLGAQLVGRMADRLARRRDRLALAARGLPDLPRLVNEQRQRLDDRAERLARALPALAGRKREALLRLAGRLLHPREQIALRRHALERAGAALAGALSTSSLKRRHAAERIGARLSPAPIMARLREAGARLDGLAARLESVSYNAVLRRGFALVTDSAGHAVTAAAAVAPGQALRLRFADGSVEATAAGSPRDGTPRRPPGPAPRQGSLF